MATKPHAYNFRRVLSILGAKTMRAIQMVGA
jgi:hypothetical protein